MTHYLPSFSRSGLRVLSLLLLLSNSLLAQNGAVTATQSFSYTGQLVAWTVPTGVTSLAIEARGAEGGPDNYARPGGKGAIVAAQVSVTPGQALSILVGQSPGSRFNRGGTGGGGTFVVAPPSSTTAPTPLVIAGGGGGGSRTDSPSKHGQATQQGSAGDGGGGAGSNGSGGAGFNGGGGGGLLGDGGASGPAAGGKAFVNGGVVGGDGGFNGAGYGGGGGGGGYSGGGSGGSVGVGGGGGSYYPTAVNPSVTTGTAANSGNGLVIISYSTFPPIRYVKTTAAGTGDGSSWANASSDLQAMINASQVQQVWVAQGTYKPGGNANTNRNVSFSMKNGVTIYGGFAGTEGSLSQRVPANALTTILSGDIGTAGNATDNSYSVISNPQGLTNSAVLDGFLITGGTGINESGGMYNNGRGDYASTSSSGIVCSPTVRNCSFQNNSSINGGGAIFNDGRNYGASSPVLTNCSFQNNSTTNGGGAITNNGSDGGTSSPVMTNCSFLNNTSRSQAGAIYSEGYGGTSNSVMTNCIVFGNKGNGGRVNSSIYTSGARISATYSLFETGILGYSDGGNNRTTAVSPFVSATDARLNACSPAINAGNSAANTTDTDLAGNPRRYNGGQIDMGAYEYQGTPNQPLTITSPSQSATTVCAGDLVRFGLMPAGTGPFNATLYRDNAEVVRYIQYPEGLEIKATIVSTQSGNYQFVVTSACNSLTTTYAPITVNPLPTQYAVTGGGSYCAEGSGVLVGLSGSQTGVSYQLQRDGNAVGSSVAGTGGAISFGAQTSAGSYTVQAINTSTTCQQAMSGSASVAVNDLPTPGLVNNGPLSCTMTTVTLTATGATGVPGNSYTFTDGNGQELTGAGNTRSVSSPGTYSVRVANAAGCTSTTTTNVISNTVVVTATLAASPSTTLTCSQPTLTLTASGGDTYRFSPNVATQTGNQATVTQYGVYSVTATSTTTGCFSTTSIIITQDDAAPSASLASSGPISCTVTSVTLTASPGGQSYRFSDGATPIGTTNQATVTTAGIYSVTVLAGNGCSSVVSTTVTGDQTPPTVSITPTSGTLTCATPTLTLTANTSAPTLRWSNGQTTPSITVNASSTYSVTATGANGCQATSNVVRIEFAQEVPPATLLASGGLSCAVTSVTLTANTGDGLSYRFSSGATQVGTGNTATVNTSGPYSVSVTNTATGCTNTASVTVSQDNSQPTVRISPSSATLTCGQPAATLTATTSAGSLRWSTGQTTNSISVSVAATYSVTVTSANGCQAVAQAIVSGTTDAPGAPTLAASPAPTTAGQPITVTASGCPAGTIIWTAQGGTGQASGNTYTLTQPGNYTLSATCSLNGCTSGSSSPLIVQIRPGGFAITGVSMVSCQLIDEAKGGYRVQFTPQYAGQSDSPISFSVVNELATTTAPAPYSLRLYTDNPVITLVAAQAGNGEARFAYNWLASCQSGTSPNRPPTTAGIPNQTIVQGQAYQLSLTSYFTDPDGQTLTFQASGLPAGLSLSGSVISGTPAQPGVSTVNVTAIDPGGLQVSTSFQLTVSPMPVTPPSGFTIVGVSTVSCQVIGAGERQLTFTPQYAGVNGQPISFSVVNELRPTTEPGPYTLRLYTDNPVITLSARKGSTVSTYRYNWLAVCNPTGRVGLSEAEPVLEIRVLGNPVYGNTAEVEISGASGQAVQLNLIDMQGKLVHAQQIDQAGTVERVRLPVGEAKGQLLLQVSTATERRVIKLLKL